MALKFLLRVGTFVTLLSATTAFTCYDDCEVSDALVSDGWCDCSKCEDESRFTCATCGDCPDNCGDRVQCAGTGQVIVSFLISADKYEETDETCIGGIVANGTERIAANASICSSMPAAFAECSKLAVSGGMASIAEEWALGGDWSDAVADKCEFLYVSWNEGDTFNNSQKNTLADIDSTDFEAAIYPLQYSANSALISALTDAGAVEVSRANVDVSDSLLHINNTDASISIEMRALNVTAKNVVNNPVIHVLDAPNTNVYVSDSSVFEVGTVIHDVLFWFENAGDVLVSDCAFIENLDCCIYVKQSVLSLKMSTFELNTEDVYYGVVEILGGATANIDSCLFDSNAASGILQMTDSIFSMKSSTFSNNIADYGCLFLYLETGASIEDCTFENNVALYGSGAVYNYLASISVKNSLFKGNVGYSSGVLNTDQKSSALVEGCKFEANLGHFYAGAMSSDFHSAITVTNSLFVENQGERGGALYIDTNSSLSTRNCKFENNTAVDDGGAIYIAMDEISANGFQLHNSLFTGNKAPNGYTAGIYANAPMAELRVSNCSFVDNSANDSFDASAIFVEAIGDMKVMNSTFKSDQKLLVRNATSFKMLANELGPNTAVTLLNTEAAAIGSVVMEANAIHSTVALRSFPVSLGYRIALTSVGKDEICEECRLVLYTEGTDLFGNEYSPLQWCDSQQTCFDVALEWTEEIWNSMILWDLEDSFFEGNGRSAFYLYNLEVNSTVNLTLECVPSTDSDTWHVCGFNAQNLSREMRVVEKPSSAAAFGGWVAAMVVIGSLLLGGF